MPTTYGSRLLEQADAYRDALEAQNQAAVDRITRSWLQAQQRVSVEMASLVDKIEAARLAGTPVSPAWLYQERRLSQLTRTIQEEVSRWAPFAEQQTADLARRVMAQAMDDAQALTQEAARTGLPGLEATFTDINPANLTQLLGHLDPGGPLRDLLVGIGGEMANQASTVLLQGVMLGKGSDWISRGLMRALDLPRHRAATIARTEALRAYRETSRLTYAASNVVETWTWHAALDRRTCPGCVVMHGTEHPVTESLDGHPRCFPAGTLVAGPSAVAATARRYEGPGVIIRTASGKELTATPNHPILTARGWVPMGQLREGDQVVAQAGEGQGAVPVNVDDHQMPARIEDVAHPFVMPGGVASVTVPVAPEDFHGDGAGSEVAVVGADCRLCPDHLAMVTEGGSKEALQLGVMLADLGLSVSPTGLLFRRDDAPAGGGVSGPGVGAVLFGGAAGVHQPVGVGGTPDGDFVGDQDSADGGTGYALPSSESVLAHAGQVVLDDVVSVASVELREHVYNLETEDGWYIANGILVHNCRCAMVPRTKPWSAISPDLADLPDTRPTIQQGKDWLAAQAPSTQRAVLGPGKWEAWRAGDITLDDMVARTHSPDWGTMRRERSMVEIREGRNANFGTD